MASFAEVSRRAGTDDTRFSSFDDRLNQAAQKVPRTLERSPKMIRSAFVVQPSGFLAGFRVALFLPFRCNKQRQKAASAGTRRKPRIARFYE
jgi:hypothetical protein